MKADPEGFSLIAGRGEAGTWIASSVIYYFAAGSFIGLVIASFLRPWPAYGVGARAPAVAAIMIGCFWPVALGQVGH